MPSGSIPTLTTCVSSSGIERRDDGDPMAAHDFRTFVWFRSRSGSRWMWYGESGVGGDGDCIDDEVGHSGLSRCD